MDAGFLNFHKEEDFSSYFLNPSEDSESYDGINGINPSSANYHWRLEHLDYERELNGDMGLIPISGDTNFTLSTSPPTKEDFNKIMTDWNNLVSLDVGNELVDDMVACTSATLHVQDAEGAVGAALPDIHIKEEGFDITQYVNESESSDISISNIHISPGSECNVTVDDSTAFQYPNSISCINEVVLSEQLMLADDATSVEVPMELERMQQDALSNLQPKFGGKRIDMARGRYLIDDDSTGESDEDVSIDVETVEETVSHPVLQAGDLDSLLEQFEATETTNMKLQQHHNTTTEDEEDDVETTEAKIESDISLDIMVGQVELISPIKSPVRRKVDSMTNKRKLDFRDEKAIETVVNSVVTIETAHKDQRKNNKQILDALPLELIDRIRQSSKRKTIPVIEPIAPNKKRMIINSNTKDKDTNKHKTNTSTMPTINNVANNKAEAILPQVSQVVATKSIQLDHAYCSLALSSLKDSGFSSCDEDDRSIIRTQPTVKSSDGKLMVSLLKTNTIKKKLNLEEYKKRLQNRSSGNNSPGGVIDDGENSRRLKHTQMLMKIAQDHIKLQSTSTHPQDGKELLIVPQSQRNQSQIAAETVVKVKIEKVDTDAVKPSPQPCRQPPKNIVMRTLVSVGTNTEESWGHLEQILQNTRLKISPNSLISSIVEHLPKPKPVIISKQVEHGEDKTIVFIDANRPKKEMANAIVQTVHSSNKMLPLRRRRRASSTSSSCSSSTSYSSSSDSLRESSRTPSPVRRKLEDQEKEVEERRVIYVGKLADDASKEELRMRFVRFGPITNVSVHFRRCADNYGFVTFLRKEDAYEAIERGNDDPNEAQYDLSFGGRRLFCKANYSDLDNMQDEMHEYWLPNQLITMIDEHEDNSFDNLLRKAQAKLRKRKL